MQSGGGALCAYSHMGAVSQCRSQSSGSWGEVFQRTVVMFQADGEWQCSLQEQSQGNGKTGQHLPQGSVVVDCCFSA